MCQRDRGLLSPDADDLPVFRKPCPQHRTADLPTLSGGDLATYRRIVNHELHNTDFFYALLVTHRRERRSGLERYAVRHFVFFRGDDAVREVRSGNVRVTDERMRALPRRVRRRLALYGRFKRWM